jgi:Domain of unknown function (DUF5642)
MTYPRRRAAVGQIASLLVAVGVCAVTVAACGNSEQPKPTGSSSAQAQPPSSSSASPAPASPAPADEYDISRVDNVKSNFPPGFKPDSQPEGTLDQNDVNKSGIIWYTQAKFDPPQCRALVIPPYADPSVGTDAASVSGDGDQGQIDVVAMRLPQPTPASQPPAGCNQVSLSGAPEATGTAEPIPAPKIDGVTTTGIKLTHADDSDPDYMFTAELGNQTSVVVMGSTADDLNPQQLLSDLLVKATAAVRGQ